MHADTLYHRMLEEERLADEAKAKGEPVPEFAPLIANQTGARDAVVEATATDADSTQQILGRLSADKRANLEKNLEKLGPRQREVEEKAFAKDILLAEKLGREVDSKREEQMEERRRRKEDGKEGVGDYVGRWFGW
jgi:hypothetical protein